ncbi:MAG: CAP domain-containing protein [Thiotrichaceae bacterium]
MTIKHLPLFVLTSLITLSCNTSPVKTSNNTAATKTATANNSGASAANSSIKSILNAHNAVRKSEGVSALKWSNSLTSYAQEWANHLNKSQVWVCNYNPPGNFAGQRPF